MQLENDVNLKQYNTLQIPVKAKYFVKIQSESDILELINTDLWEKFLIAIRNGIYGAEDEFKKLPKSVQRFVGGPEQLQDIAHLDSETIHSVVKGQFLKQIEYIKQSIKEQELMSPQTRKILEQKEILKIKEEN